MTPEEFNTLVDKRLGIKTNVFMTPLGVPSVHMTDYCVAWGAIFKDYITDYDFWGIPNWDIVYGRIERYLPDTFLNEIDVWTDDVDAINGIFTLFRNNDRCSNLFRRIPDWEAKFEQKPCNRW